MSEANDKVPKPTVSEVKPGTPIKNPPSDFSPVSGLKLGELLQAMERRWPGLKRL